MPRHLLPVSHQKQKQRVDCLAACAAMVLNYIGCPYTYRQLLRLLRIRQFGAPAPNIVYLEQLGVAVEYRAGTLDDLKQHITLGRPCIVFLDTAQLPYWSEGTFHAAVVVGIDDMHVYLNDPAFDQSPQRVSPDDFELAWLERGYFYATISQRA
jgi:ABC-type bacteriocin/lantibiotic exporter with double-glycine peptidase domain